MEQIAPLISIIVPNYNHENYLVQRLESIFNQTYTNFEVILLDDCSTDTSRAILLEYAKNPKVSHCVFNEINSGNTFVQWNKGISLAKGEYIWVAESDDFCELNFLEEVTKPLLENKGVTLSYCQSNRVDESGKITGNWLNYTDNLDASLFLTHFVMEGNDFIEQFLIRKNVIPNASGVLFQKARAVQLGELDIDPVLKTCGDWLFYLKLLTNSKAAFIPKSLNNFRHHSASVITSTVNTESLGSIIDIDIKNRKKIINFLSIEKPHNLAAILKINRQIIKELKYEKALFYIRNNHKTKGGLILCTMLDVFVRKYKLKLSFKLKRNHIFKTNNK